ncbi:MAG: GNAT family N-acetyltransferase [Verrucomicrobiota bacterium]
MWSTTNGDDRNTQFAFKDYQCIGIAALYREPSARSGDILMMWVDPRCRGSVAASLLVKNLLSWAKGSGFSAVCLDVTDTNAGAIRFYEKQGFRDTGETVEIDYHRNLRGVRMTLKLS